MAIIDILTPYDAKKKAAHAAKTVKHGVSSPCLHPGPGGGASDPQGGLLLEGDALVAPSPRTGTRKSSPPGCLVFFLRRLRPIPSLQLADMPNLLFF